MAVYFLRAGATNAIKIGLAKDVAKRVALLQPHNHERLSIIRTIETAGRAEECWLHHHYAFLRLRGEWFRFHSSMLTIAPPARTWSISDPARPGEAA